MKIEYDLKDDLYKHQDLSWGVFLMKKGIRKNPHKKIKKYSSILRRGILFVVLIFIMTVLICAFIDSEKITYAFIPVISYLISYMILILIIGYVMLLICYLLYKKKRCLEGTLEFNKEGVIDQTDEITIKFLWNRINFIVIKDETIIVVPNHPTGLIANINKNDIEKIVKGIRKYNKEVLIIIA